MKKFSDYDEVKVNNFGERLKLGGHICKVLEAKVEEVESKNDGKKYEILVITFDIVEPDEQAGFYQRKFTEEAQKDALNTKWKGCHRITVPTDDSEDYIKSKFKAFTTSVEESNPGYKWNWEENTLVGKTFGGVFGLEEFTLDDGRTLSMAKIRYVKSTDKIFEAEVPKVKLVDGSYLEYQEYVEMKKAQRNNQGNYQGNYQGNNQRNYSSSTSEDFAKSVITDDDLPF